jgi:hypothetical protein
MRSRRSPYSGVGISSKTEKLRKTSHGSVMCRGPQSTIRSHGRQGPVDQFFGAPGESFHLVK